MVSFWLSVWNSPSFQSPRPLPVLMFPRNPASTVFATTCCSGGSGGLSRPQTATHQIPPPLDQIPPPHAWHRPANLPQILEHSPALGLMTFCQFISGTFGNVAAGTHLASDRLDAPVPADARPPKRDIT